MTIQSDDDIKKAARLLFEQDNRKLALVRAEGQEEKLGRVFQVMVERAGPTTLGQYEERARAAFELAERFPVAREDLGDQRLIEHLLRGRGDFCAVGIQSPMQVLPGRVAVMSYQPPTVAKLLRLVVEERCAASFSIDKVRVANVEVLWWPTPASMFWQPRPLDPEPLRLTWTVNPSQVVQVHVRNTSERECRFDGALGFFVPHERMVDISAKAGKDLSFPSDLLQVGDRGDDVRKWQRVVCVNTIDGIFGPDTEAATIVWQGRHGLETTGRVNVKHPLVRAALGK